MKIDTNTNSQSENSRERAGSKCPLCDYPVRRVRYTIPFGHCPKCGQYLRVENREANELLRIPVLLLIALSAYALEWLGLVAIESFPLFTLWFGYLGLFFVYDKVVGELVPAVWWGLFSLTDDDRLPANTDGNASAAETVT